MAKKATIGAKIALDGEKEWKQAISNINKQAKTLASEMKLVTSEFQDNANSTEALRKKSEILAKQYELQNKKVEEAKNALDNAQQNMKKNASVVEEYRAKLQTAKEQLETLESSTDATTEQLQKQREEVEKVQKQLESVEKGYTRAENATYAWQETVNNAKVGLNNLGSELKQTNKYLDEAENSVDGTAASIDQFGKKIKESKEDVNDFAEEMGEAAEGASVFGDVLKAELASDAINAGITAVKDTISELAGAVTGLAKDGQKALNEFAAKTGATKEELDSFETVMDNIYENNFGDGMQDIAEVMAVVEQNIKDIDPSNLEEVSTNAILMRDTFGYETQEQIRAVKMLMDQFGLTSKEAFTLMAQGAQEGLDKNDDLLDTINEYSVHFKQLGYNADEMFNMLVNGAENGTFSVDKLGDAVKEFGIRVKDGTADDAFKDLGLNADALKDKFNAGGEAAKEASEEVMSAFLNMDSATEQYTLGVMMFGTMFEDLGVEAIGSLMDIQGEVSKTADTLDDINDIRYDDFETSLEGLGRQILIRFKEPFSESLDTANLKVKNLSSEIADGKLGKSIDGIAESAGRLLVKFVDFGADALPVVADGFEWLVDHSALVTSGLKGIAAAVLTYKAVTIYTQVATAMKTLTTATQAAEGAQLALNAAQNLNPYGLIAAGITAVTVGVYSYMTSMDEASETVLDFNEELQETVENLGELEETASKSRIDFSENISQIENQRDSLQLLIDELYSLDSKEQQTQAEKERMKAIVDQLNSSMDGLNLEIDEQTGLLSKNQSAVEGVANAMEKQALQQAKQERYAEIAAQIVELESQIKKAKDETAEAEKIHAEYRDGEFAKVKQEYEDEKSWIMDKIGLQYEEKTAYEEGTAQLQSYYSEVNNGKIAIIEQEENLEALKLEFQELGLELGNTSIMMDENGQSVLDWDATVQSATEEFISNAESIKLSYAEMYAEAEDSLKSQVGLFEEFSSATELSKDDLQKNLEGQVEGINEWADNITRISKICSQEFVDEISSLGLDSAGEIKVLASMTEEELKAYENAWNDKNEAVKNAAVASVGDCTEKILAEEERLIQKLEDQLPQWDSTGTILGNGIGEGVIKGIEDSNYQVQQAMKAQARKALEAAKKELDVNSPSKKARKLYHSVGEGSAKGLEDGEGMVESAARKVANASLKGLATANNTVKSTSSTAKSATTTMSQVQYSSEVAKAIKTVFEGMSIELGEQQVGKFVDTRLRRMN
jgi:phage-related minor tail protein